MQRAWARFRAPRLQLFVCILVHVLWSLVAIGAFIGTYNGRLHVDADGGADGFWVQQGNDEWGWALLALFLFPMLVHLQFLAPKMINGDYVELLFGLPSYILESGVPMVKAIFVSCTMGAVALVDNAEELRAEETSGCCGSCLNGFLYVCMVLMAVCLGVCGGCLGIALSCVVLALGAALFACILLLPFGGFVLFLPLVLMDVAARLASSNQRPWPRLPTPNQAPTPTRHHPATTPSPSRPLSPPSSRQCPF